MSRRTDRLVNAATTINKHKNKQQFRQTDRYNTHCKILNGNDIMSPEDFNIKKNEPHSRKESDIPTQSKKLNENNKHQARKQHMI